MTENLNRGVSEDTGAEVEGAEGATPTGEMSTGEMSTGAAFAGTEGAEALIGQASVMVALLPTCAKVRSAMFASTSTVRPQLDS